MVGSKSDVTIEVAIMRKLDVMTNILTDIKVGMEIVQTRLTAIELCQSYMKSELGIKRSEIAEASFQDHGN